MKKKWTDARASGGAIEVTTNNPRLLEAVQKAWDAAHEGEPSVTRLQANRARNRKDREPK